MTALEAVRNVPPHVDPKLVVDFNVYDDPRFHSAGGIQEAMAQLRKEAPDVFWSPALCGYWVIQGYDAVIDAGRRPDLFSSTQMGFPPTPGSEKVIPLMMDPPIHGAWRKPLMDAFTPSQMMHRQEAIRELCVELIDKVAASGRADFFQAVCEPLPVLIFMKIMGLDTSRFREFRTLAVQAISGTEAAPRREASSKVALIMKDLIAERMRERRDDLVSKLCDLEVEGRKVTEKEVLGYCNLLFFAGLDTVANMMGFSVRTLAHDQELQRRLRDDPSKIPQAVEEMLRRNAVAPVARIVMKDELWRGVQVRKGDCALINYPSAGLDEKAFKDPTEIDLTRQTYNHQAFGAGPHRCVGRHLARIELHVMFEELFKRIPTFRPDPNGVEKVHGGHVFGLDALPIVWEPKHADA
jgi:cytochrome P450